MLVLPRSGSERRAGSSTARKPAWSRWPAAQRWLIALRSFAIFILCWQLLYLWNGNPIQLPSPLRVATAFLDLAADGELFENAAVSAGGW